MNKQLEVKEKGMIGIHPYALSAKPKENLSISLPPTYQVAEQTLLPQPS